MGLYDNSVSVSVNSNLSKSMLASREVDVTLSGQGNEPPILLTPDNIGDMSVDSTSKVTMVQEPQLLAATSTGSPKLRPFA